MKRVAVFIDAGYFWVQACALIAGTYKSRTQLVVNFESLRAQVLAEVEAQLPNGDLLRVYWYDGPGTGGKTPEHRKIEELDDFKLRLGTRNGEGQQKGVDGLIIADLISLTQQRSITHAILMSGDADITPGVMAAQNLGLRVHLLSLGSAAATSKVLAAEMDRKRTWSLAEVATFATAMEKNSQPLVQVEAAIPARVEPADSGVQTPVSSSATVQTLDFRAIAQAALSTLLLPADASRESFKPAGDSHRLSPEVDRALLATGRHQLGRILEEAEKRQLRDEFRLLLV